MKRKYDEKLLEDTLRDYPQYFLGEPLEILQQQPTIGGFRPDLIFRDQKGLPVIVEVQLKALDRNHLYRSLEYRDLYKEKTGVKEVRVILFCNSIPLKYEKVLSAHGVNCMKIGKKDFLKKLISLVPKIKIISASWDKKVSGSLTPNSLLREIQNNLVEDNGLFLPDAYVFWIAWGSLSVTDDRTRNLSYPLANVATPTKGLIDYYGLKDPRTKTATLQTRHGAIEVCIPLELIVSGNLLDIPDHSCLDAFPALLDFIPRDPRQRTVDIHLGSFKYNDPFGMGSYIEGRKRKSETLCARYGPVENYNTLLFLVH